MRGCHSKPQRKLSQHMKQKHSYLTPEQRQGYMRMARRIKGSVIRNAKVSAGQSTLHQVVPKWTTGGSEPEPEHAEQEDEPVLDEPVLDEPMLDDSDSVEEGTRNWARYDCSHPMFFRFEQYLAGIDGGERSEKTAREITIDVSKYLRYACGQKCPNPDWSRLTDRDQLMGYVEKLKRAKVGPEGQLSKLDTFSAALRYLKVHVLADERHALYSKVTQMENVLTGWKTTLRKTKRKLRKSRLQKLSSESLSLDEVSALLDSQAIWTQFNQTCIDAERGETIAACRLDQATIALAGSLLFKNWQRPGAVVNATLAEFEEAKVVREGREVLYIMSVENHKTALEGVAKVILQPVDQARVVQYIDTVRQVQDVKSVTQNLFILTGGRAIRNMSTKLKKLGKRFGLSLPSACRVRKIGATCVAANLGDSAQAHLVTRHMSHSASTEARYYQAIIGDRHAVSAYGTMTALREGGSDERGKSLARRSGSRDRDESSAARSGDDVNPVQRRRVYSARETNFIEEFFDAVIQRGDRVSLRECAKFLKAHPMDRSDKNIQDKVKSLVKSSQAK